MRAAQALVAVAILGLTLAGNARAVPFTVEYADGPNEGFNDPTLGPRRKAAFAFALEIWAARLSGNIPVHVRARMDPLGGTATRATLAFAGPTFVFRDFAGRKLANTWYVAALASQMAGRDLAAGPEISATFNSSVDGAVLGSVNWYYGFDEQAGNNVDFVTTALHEIGHGLGFLDFIDPGDGRWLQNVPDAYGRNLTRSGIGAFPSLSNNQRLAALTSGAVVWNGATVSAIAGAVPIYAPNPYDDGSSISHWDPSAFPNLLMEPFDTGPDHDLDLTPPAFRDVGWGLNSGFFGGVFVAGGNLDASGFDEVITGAGIGGGPLVRTFRENNTNFGTSFFPYPPAFRGGVRVASCDVDGDGQDDIVTAPGPGGGPHVRIWDVTNPASPVEIAGFFAYPASFTGGIFVACADVNGDGKGDIITGAGAGGGPHVRVFRFDGPGLTPIFSFFPYNPAFPGGVFVAAGDVNGDGRADIITGAGAGGGPHVRVFSGLNGAELFGFFAYASSFTGGVRVAAGNVTGDVRAEILTAPGAGGGPHVRAFGNTGEATPTSLFAYPGFAGGVFVGSGNVDGTALDEIITAPGAGGGPHVRTFRNDNSATSTTFLAY